ncbi:hypothetical protein [Streptomyces sp. NPDC002690]
MGRGAQSLARVAVIVRAGAAPLWWPGLLVVVVGALVPAGTGRRIGLLAGAALFVVTLAVVATAGVKRYAELGKGAARAGRTDVLQNRAVTVRNWRRTYRWWLLGAFLVALGVGFLLPGAGGMVLAGAGAGLWLRASRIGRLEQREDVLYWVRTDWVKRGRAAGKQVKAYRTTGPVAGDALAGGRRRVSV